MKVDDDWFSIEIDSRQFVKKDSLDQLIFCQCRIELKRQEEALKKSEEVMKMDNFIDFLRHLDAHNIPYDIDQTGDDYVIVNIDIPGERWEVNFSENGRVDAERFGNIGDVAGQEIMDYLYDNYSI